jgi:hypothetical protein
MPDQEKTESNPPQVHQTQNPLEIKADSPLAKVDVEGSNPFARSIQNSQQKRQLLNIPADRLAVIRKRRGMIESNREQFRAPNTLQSAPPVHRPTDARDSGHVEPAEGTLASPGAGRVERDRAA